MNFRDKAFFIGMGGDLALQVITKQRGDFAGLKEYYEIHGEIESLFIAGGMMFGFSYLYQLSGLPITNTNLFLYGGMLDVIFRNGKISKTLNETYYKNTTPLQSFIFGGIPMVLPNLI